MEAFESEALSGADEAENDNEGADDPHRWRPTPYRITVDLSDEIAFVVKAIRSSLLSSSISTTRSTTTSAPATLETNDVVFSFSLLDPLCSKEKKRKEKKVETLSQLPLSSSSSSTMVWHENLSS
ncbi:hypothetical protein LOK49_LG01G01587 [Camellia lanceoleosa]|uniref:Uncharacterized protein n=1 Tax=Camellia lanceoleosa TaxID=1840588 RepID=A0ACC0J3S1_9ERIC|nr:hypothetical protein LOK49_LG01G01587 [Camellia lanceoleosa]